MLQYGNAKYDVLQQLQKDILSMQGFKPLSYAQQPTVGLGIIEQAFPLQRFPTAAIHELLSNEPEHAAATNGFIAALLGKLMKNKAMCVWIGIKPTIYPSALQLFGILPHQVVFIHANNAKQALWAMEEALKCESLAAVIGEIKEISLTESRRLQLAVEHSRVTGFIHRYQSKANSTIASVSRWKITPIPSLLNDDMPGMGFPRWNVQLLKVRNGKPGTWDIEWRKGNFRLIETEKPAIVQSIIRKTG
jgi:protein ImuA